MSGRRISKCFLIGLNICWFKATSSKHITDCKMDCQYNHGLHGLAPIHCNCFALKHAKSTALKNRTHLEALSGVNTDIRPFIRFTEVIQDHQAGLESCPDSNAPLMKINFKRQLPIIILWHLLKRYFSSCIKEVQAYYSP